MVGELYVILNFCLSNVLLNTSHFCIELEAFTAAEEMLGLDPRANQDTKRVQDLMKAQMELKGAMTGYVNDHHEETFDMSDV